MGLRGPASMPNNVTELRGNPGKRALNTGEVRARRILPPGSESTDGIAAFRFRPPAHLDAEGKAEWKRLVPILAAMKVLTEADRPALATICDEWSLIVRCDRELAKKNAPYVNVTDKGFEQPSTWVALRHNAIAQHSKLIQQFGMSPASRARIVTAEEAAPKVSGTLNGEWRRSG